MLTNSTTLRTRLRVDLSEATADRWTDADLDRHIQHAVRDMNRVAPQELTDTSLAIPDPASRELDISSIAGLITVTAVEYPVGSYPRRLRHFQLWGSTLTLLTDEIPVADDPITICYTAQHIVDAEGSTLPGHLEDLALTGAAGYALLDYLAYTENRITIGDRAAEQLRAHANDLLMQFRQDLTALTRMRQHAVRTGELWTGDTR